MADESAGKAGRQRSRYFTAVPACLELPTFPVLGHAALEKRALSGLKTHRFFGKPTTLEEAERAGREIIQEHLARYGAGDAEALGELLRLSREFAHDPRVTEALADLALRPRGNRKPGRPPGFSPRVQETALGIVRVVEGMHATTGIKRTHILRALASQGFEQLSEDMLRHRYYQGRRHPSLRAFYTSREDQRMIVQPPPDVPHPEGSFFLTGMRIGIQGADRLPSKIQVRATERPGAVHFLIELR
jgi:hypothetical protein